MNHVTIVRQAWVADQAALHGLLAKVGDLGLELNSVRRTDPTKPAWRGPMPQPPTPPHKRPTPPRRQLQVSRRARGRRPASPIDRRTPSGRLLPW